MYRRTTLGVAAIALAASVGTAGAQTYPSQQIKIIVPFAAGALTDFLGRLAGEHIKNKTGQAVIVENRTGAGGNIGLAAVVASPPDGYTLGLVGVTSFVVNPLLYKSMSFDPMKDLVPVAPIVEAPLMLMAHKKVGVATFKELVAHAKANPGKLNFGSSGAGTPPHIIPDAVFRSAGLKITHVAYRGIAPALNDLISGSIDLLGGSPGPMVGHRDKGTLKFLAVLAPNRLGRLPDIPTVSEASDGKVKQELSSWWGLAAPAKTSPAVVKTLNELIGSMGEDPAVRAKLEKIYLEPMKMSPEKMMDTLRAEQPMWAKVISDAGIKPK
jgi:tripartite-type tricarboxylate transporter receptor subunit TctC